MTSRSRLSRHLRSNVVGYLALVVATSGTAAYAVPAAIAKNSVGSAQIINGQVKAKDLAGNAVTGAKVKDGSLAGADVADGTLTGADVKDGSLGSSDLGALAGLLLAPSAVPAGGITLPGGQHLYSDDGGRVRLDSDLFLDAGYLRVGDEYCPNASVSDSGFNLTTESGVYCFGSAFAVSDGPGGGTYMTMKPVVGTYPYTVGPDKAVLFFEEDTSTNPDTIRLKVKWPNDTVTTLASGADEDND